MKRKNTQKFATYRRFKKKNRLLHVFISAIAVVFFWRGVWGLIDLYLLPQNPFMSNLISVAVAFGVIYFDDFHLKELE